MKVGPDVSVTHSRASSQWPVQREDSRVRGESSSRGANLRKSTNARTVRRNRKTIVCTWILARNFLSGALWGTITSWHLAKHRDAFTAPTHSSVALGMWLRICVLLTKQALVVWRILVLVKKPALWKVNLSFSSTEAIVIVSVFGYLCMSLKCPTKQHANKSSKLTRVCRLHIVRLKKTKTKKTKHNCLNNYAYNE